MPSTQVAVNRSGSYFVAVTDKSGLFSFAGHRHAILATRWSADLHLNSADISLSRATVTIPVASLAIDSSEARTTAALGPGPSPKEVEQIRTRMLGPGVLDASTFPEIVFRVTAIGKIREDLLQLKGDLLLHGHMRQIVVPVVYKQEGPGRFGLAGAFTIRQTDFGIEPAEVAGGTVKVKNDITIRFQLSIVQKV